MQFDLDNICDVCGRGGLASLRQQAGPYVVVICHACRVQGVSDPAAVAGEYRSSREQADAKIARHRRFLNLPGPGRYPVILPRGAALPPICCGCMGPPEERMRVFAKDARPALSPRQIIAGVAIGVFAVAFLPGIWKVIIPAVLVWLAFRKGLSAPASVPLLHVPICHRCDVLQSAGRSFVEVERSDGPFIAATFASFEYAQMLRESNPQPAGPIDESSGAN